MKRTICTMVLMTALAVASLAILQLSSGPALLAQGTETPPSQGSAPETMPGLTAETEVTSEHGQGAAQAGQDQFPATLPPEVHPFVLTLTAHRDTWLAEGAPETNYGTDLELTVGQVSVGYNRSYTLVDFDLSTLPADAVPVSATLSLHAAETAFTDAPQDPLAVPFPIVPHAITSTWTEQFVTWNTRPGWSHLGDPAVQYVPADWTVFDVSNIVQAWLEGSVPYHGILLALDGTATGTRSFQARTTAYPPELTIYYTRQALLEATQDTWIEFAHPSTSHGTDTQLRTASPNYVGQERRLLVGFDFASLPENIAVISATLEMLTQWNREAESNPSRSPVLYADAVLTSWDESLTWNDPLESLYLDDPPTSYVNLWNYWDVTNIARRWALDLDPRGILVRVDPASVSTYSFYSREWTAPRLKIAYGAAPPSCNPVTSVRVNGVSTGLNGTEYTFQAVPLPAGADPPESISWQVTDHPDRYYGDSVTVSWATAGPKTLIVVVAHCDGSVSTVHEVAISDPPPDCTAPLERLHLSGPVVVAAGSEYTYRASSVPNHATDPVTFTWQATDQSTSVYTTDTNWTEQAYTWNVAGGKTITVTGENCGGSAVTYQGVEAVQPADLPDLVISTAWLELDQDRIGYLIHNRGLTTAPAGFYVSLELQASTPAVTQHTSPLAPGGVAVGFLEYAWDCRDAIERVGVLADWSDVVVEADEINNLWLENWACDQQPPEIVGPGILDTGETTAEVGFTTSEPCDGWLEYGTSPYDSTPDTMPGGTSATVHNVRLSGLTAGTTYFVRAFCTDAAGLTSNSEAVAFETLPLGAGPPRLRSLTLQRYPSPMYDFWQVILEMEVDPYMDRVEFAMDGRLVGLDYSADNSGDYPTYSAYLSPIELGLSRSEFFRRHTFQATAFRQHPDGVADLIEDLTPSGTDLDVSFSILSPHNLHRIYVSGDTVPAGTTLEVSVRAAVFDWHCTWGGFSDGDVVPPGMDTVDCDDLTPREIDSLELWIDGIQVDTMTPAPGEIFGTLQAPIGGLGLGDHQIEAVAYESGVPISRDHTFVVMHGEPGLEVERSIARDGNALRITLELHNAGPVDARVVSIYDNIAGLQQINSTDPSGDYSVGLWTWDWTAPGSSQMHNSIVIHFLVPGEDEMEYVTLPPGADYTVSYVVVPVLFEQETSSSIGTQGDVIVELVEIGRITRSEKFDVPGTLVDDPEDGLIPLASAVANAVRQADYVIVTNPRRVHDMLITSPQLETAQDLFSNMAELASLKNGVLGYLYTYDDTDVLDDLIEPGNYWAEALNPVFNDKDDGYVLIVGETEIVASDYVGDSHFFTGPNIVEHVHDSDLWYANTRGETARPELVVGRVIGNTAKDLDTYLENVIAAARGEPGYGFNRSRALLISGTESRHRDNVDHVAGQMENEIPDVNPVHWLIWDEDWDSAKQATKPKMTDNGIIFYNGHGNAHQWCYGVSSWDLTGTNPFYDLGSTNPAVFAAACKTGHYESGDDVSIAEAFLAAGAGAYVGSTESVESDSTSDAFRRLYSRWSAGESMGQALNQMKRAIWDLDWGYDHRKLWAFTSNLYGDPKYGRLQEAAAATATEESVGGSVDVTQEAEATAIKVKLPNVEFYRTETGDRVDLPGAGTLAEVGGYPVPVWFVSIDYQAGRSVQEVQLVSRGLPVAYSGLSMPVVQGEHEGNAGQAQSATPIAPGAWYPELEWVYDWSVEEGSDGTTTLEIRIFPFYYNASTTDALFYRTYQFSVETIDTLVDIESLAAGKSQYEPREPVDLQLTVRNDGRPRDVMVQGSVRTRVTNDVLGGLPLRTLHGLTGRTMVDLVWDTRGYEAGDYQIVVELLDTAGQLLDTAVTEVELGAVGARLTGLRASQETFAPGDSIALQMGVRNTGTVLIDGVGVFRIQSDTELVATEVITVPFRALAPGFSVKLDGVWDTRGVEAYSYRVLAYAKFRSQATEPLALTLYRPRIFLPLVLRRD